ncbi:hypothetical protein [Endozoicomonas sp. Mp262]|uniref:hypothetical protein n=1 Tax=Endozoicomonas sp. Mp262 TaxID=2919499 RepID=UPI0021D85CBC
MEKDSLGNSVWHLLEPGQFIQGLIATDNPFLRIYVVTETCTHSNHKNNRWPRLIMPPSA